MHGARGHQQQRRPGSAMVTWLPSQANRLVAVASTGSARPAASSARARSTEETA